MQRKQETERDKKARQEIDEQSKRFESEWAQKMQCERKHADLVYNETKITRQMSQS